MTNESGMMNDVGERTPETAIMKADFRSMF